MDCAIKQPTVPGCRTVYGVGVRQLAFWNCGFKSRPWHGCLGVGCRRVEVFVLDRLIFQKSLAEFGVSEYNWILKNEA
jgi:hypothetical protein